jgi:nucleoside-diphosphate-sugar epimerase
VNVVFSSSCATYGVPERLPLKEDAAQNPVNPYGYTKLAVERMLKDAEAAYGTRHVALRYFNAAGADPDGCRPIAANRTKGMRCVSGWCNSPSSPTPMSRPLTGSRQARQAIRSISATAAAFRSDA